MNSREQGLATSAGGLQEQQTQIISNFATISDNPTVHPSSAHSPFNSTTWPPVYHQQNQHQEVISLDSLKSSFHGPLLVRPNMNIKPNMKKKRGRPRKYCPLQFPSMTSNVSNPPTSADSVVGLRSTSSDAATESLALRNRGRPPGSGERQIAALGGTEGRGAGFTPYMITVRPVEDITAKLLALSRQGPRTVCILSASGAVNNVTVNRPLSGPKCYTGQHQIVSLSGFVFGNDDWNRSGGLSISFAGSDGALVGGAVLGMLMAATPVQVLVGIFMADGSSNMLNFGVGPSTQDDSSESLDDRDAFRTAPIPHSYMQQMLQTSQNS